MGMTGTQEPDTQETPPDLLSAASDLLSAAALAMAVAPERLVGPLPRIQYRSDPEGNALFTNALRETVTGGAWTR
ncbi:unnamed protein product [Ectocarpus sp. 12 AP-2014]